MPSFDGFLTVWDGFDHDGKGVSGEKFFSGLQCIEGLRSESDGAENWKYYRLISPRPLVDGQRTESTGSYEYVVVFRVNRETGNIVIAAEAKEVADFLLSNAINRKLLPKLRNIKIKVRELAEHVIFSADQPYAATALYAHTPSFGDNLKSLSMYGDDLAQAGLVRSNFKLLNPFIIGLRARDTRREAARLGSDGSLRFYERGKGNFSDLEKCLNYVNHLGLYVR